MRIIQMLSTIAGGDAVSNDAVAFDKVIRSMGYSGGIYADSIAPNVERGVAKHVDKVGELNKSDIIMYHFSTGSKLNFKLAEFPCRKILVYHNVTPPEFFKGNDESFALVCEEGLKGARFLADKVDYCLAVSEFNKNDLINMGYKCKIDVLPIVIPMGDYKKRPSRDYMKDYGGGEKTNILFTGRIAPNKKQENVIAAFYYYRKLYNHKSRLILAGSYRANDQYYLRLVEYLTRLGIGGDVIMTGHAKFNEIIACYRTADVFLCMSEHEGFCVPIVESMMFDVPVVAYNTTAVGGTMGGSGILLDSSDPILAAACVDKLVRDKALRSNVVAGQRERLKDFEYEKIASRLRGYINDFV
jgi:glycosyltransferase involved in cell wall biosynthesis